MANTKIKSGISNKRARITANDLSLLNGISEKINEEYLKNIREIISYNIAEQVRDGCDVVNIDIPYIGELTISRKLLDSTKNKNGLTYKFEYDFVPSLVFYKSICKAFEDGDCDLPKILADKYGTKIYNMYESFLGEYNE